MKECSDNDVVAMARNNELQDRALGKTMDEGNKQEAASPQMPSQALKEEVPKVPPPPSTDTCTNGVTPSLSPLVDSPKQSTESPSSQVQ